MALEDRAALIVGVSTCGGNENQANENKNINSEIKQAKYDAIKIADLLSRNGDEKVSRNFQVRCLLSDKYKEIKEKIKKEIKEIEQHKGIKEKIEKEIKEIEQLTFFNKGESCFGLAKLNNIEEELQKLFFSEVSTAIFYFSGHASWNEQGKYAELIPSDYFNEEKGIKFDWLLDLLLSSTIKNKIVILDCCFSGCLGFAPEKLFKDIIILKDGITILTSSRNNEISKAEKESLYSLFTKKLISALSGGSANLLGEVTLFNAYSFIEETCFYNDQRPILRTSSKADCVLREVEPAIDLTILKNLTKYFPKEDTKIALSIISYPELNDLNDYRRVRFEAYKSQNKGTRYSKDMLQLLGDEIDYLEFERENFKKYIEREELFQSFTNIIIESYEGYTENFSNSNKIKELENKIEEHKNILKTTKSPTTTLQAKTPNTVSNKEKLESKHLKAVLDEFCPFRLKKEFWETEDFKKIENTKVKVFYTKNNYRELLLLSMIDKGLIKYTEQTKKYIEKKLKLELINQNKIKNYIPAYEIFKPIYEKIKPFISSFVEIREEDTNISECLTFYLEYELTDLGRYYWNRIKQGMI